ncbi:MAG: hypothetical protein CVV64_13780 [Candidatus Wallbacteria bacterium HGW-Wallbacteria-1]|jgi:serine/threonine protein kinase|uniref:non-specific serine/threonine protein kinase n=1 Tax=Candidatus Wallbacteria bacterium HGW-Wallbacteria-1 TaxID=2013854 RepID=A0A2N1PMB5_9BACT|nr:MAG: hypothetical protein CVV64_13780 [Candidatus Wallbacteria bacterium HGW-Wallbacteria-1]
MKQVQEMLHKSGELITEDFVTIEKEGTATVSEGESAHDIMFLVSMNSQSNSTDPALAFNSRLNMNIAATKAAEILSSLDDTLENLLLNSPSGKIPALAWTAAAAQRKSSLAALLRRVEAERDPKALKALLQAVIAIAGSFPGEVFARILRSASVQAAVNSSDTCEQSCEPLERIKICLSLSPSMVDDRMARQVAILCGHDKDEIARAALDMLKGLGRFRIRKLMEELAASSSPIMRLGCMFLAEGLMQDDHIDLMMSCLADTNGGVAAKARRTMTALAEKSDMATAILSRIEARERENAGHSLEAIITSLSSDSVASSILRKNSPVGSDTGIPDTAKSVKHGMQKNAKCNEHCNEQCNEQCKEHGDEHGDALRAKCYQDDSSEASPNLSESGRKIAVELRLNFPLHTLEDPDPLIRLEAVEEIGASSDPELIRLLPQRLAFENDCHIRERILSLISTSRNPAIMAILDSMISSSGSEKRNAALDALSCLDDPQARAIISRALSDSDPKIRQRAILALNRYSPEEAIDMVEKELSNPSISADDRLQVIYTLAGMESHRAMGLLEKLAMDENAMVRKHASASLSLKTLNPLQKMDIDRITDAFISGRAAWEIFGMVGEGGMGKVFDARHRITGNRAAVKVLHPHLAASNTMVARFRREAEARFEHPNIVKVLDSGTMGDISFIAMEFVEGENLQQKLVREKRLSPEQTIPIILGTCRGFSIAHSKGCCHRDVKPENILIDLENVPKISDFGLMKAVDGNVLTLAGTVLGTPYYIPPEQAKGMDADNRSDIYSLGIMLFRMVTGRLPFTGSNPVAVAQMHANTPMPRPGNLIADLPAQLEEIIMKATMKKPAQRYQNVDDMIIDLLDFEKNCRSLLKKSFWK